MSIYVSKLVWESSSQKSGNLLVLLAISDHAADDGTAFPGIKLLARKTRLSSRQVRRCIQELRRSGELSILPKKAPGGGAWYQIRLEALCPTDGPPRPAGVSPASSASDAGDSTYINELSNEPSVQPLTYVALKARHTGAGIKPQVRDTSSLKLVSPAKNGF